MSKEGRTLRSIHTELERTVHEHVSSGEALGKSLKGDVYPQTSTCLIYIIITQPSRFVKWFLIY